jgi:hypothetical protein
MANPYYHGTEEWSAYESGCADTRLRLAAGKGYVSTNEDHLVMIGAAYMEGVRDTRLQSGQDDVE